MRYGRPELRSVVPGANGRPRPCPRTQMPRNRGKLTKSAIRAQIPRRRQIAIAASKPARAPFQAGGCERPPAPQRRALSAEVAG